MLVLLLHFFLFESLLTHGVSEVRQSATYNAPPAGIVVVALQCLPGDVCELIKNVELISNFQLHFLGEIISSQVSLWCCAAIHKETE